MMKGRKADGIRAYRVIKRQLTFGLRLQTREKGRKKGVEENYKLLLLISNSICNMNVNCSSLDTCATHCKFAHLPINLSQEKERQLFVVKHP